MTSEHASKPGDPHVGTTTALIEGETASKPSYATSTTAGAAVASSAVNWTSATAPGTVDDPAQGERRRRLRRGREARLWPVVSGHGAQSSFGTIGVDGLDGQFSGGPDVQLTCAGAAVKAGSAERNSGDGATGLGWLSRASRRREHAATLAGRGRPGRSHRHCAEPDQPEEEGSHQARQPVRLVLVGLARVRLVRALLNRSLPHTAPDQRSG